MKISFFLWWCAWGCIGRSLALVLGPFDWKSAFGGFSKKRSELIRVRETLREIGSRIEAGRIPETQLWDLAKALPAPWGKISGDGLEKLRSAGAAILPTLKRTLSLIDEEEESLLRARARSSQAWMQAISGISLVPLFGGALLLLLPETRTVSFAALAGFAFLWAVMGGAWILRIAENARWSELHSELRHWVIASFCAGERFLSLVRSGLPPDLAWEGAIEFLSAEAPGLALRWGASLWSEGEGDLGFPPGSSASRFAKSGEELKRAIQSSIMEGTPCIERSESVILGWRREWSMSVERALTLLPQKALIPLFVCTAPPLLILLSGGIYSSVAEAWR